VRVRGAREHNLRSVDVDLPRDALVVFRGVSGSGKSTLVSQVLVDLVAEYLGQPIMSAEEEIGDLEQAPVQTGGGEIASGAEDIRRLVVVDQKPIGRTPRSNMATYTGMFDHVRKLFASTKLARSRKYDAGRFSFNVAKGRCETCTGEGFVCVELLFLPSVYSPCPTCHGARFNAKTLEVLYREKSIADVLTMTVDAAAEFFSEDEQVGRALRVLQEVGLGYLRLGQPATELSGGEVQRVKLATELQRVQHGNTLYVFDEPTTGLHPSDVDRLLRQLQNLVSAGNTVVVVEHDMQVIASSDWVIDMGPGAGDEGGQIVAAGPPAAIAKSRSSKTARFLAQFI
jgi:excinuclease ABC subunit A